MGKIFAVKVLSLPGVSFIHGNDYVKRECDIVMTLRHVSPIISTIIIRFSDLLLIAQHHSCFRDHPGVMGHR